MTKLLLRPVAVGAVLAMVALGAPALATADVTMQAAPTTTTTVAPATTLCTVHLKHWGAMESQWNHQRDAILRTYNVSMKSATRTLNAALKVSTTAAQKHAAHVAFRASVALARSARASSLALLGPGPVRPANC